MKILCVGDIYGKPGRALVKKYLPELKKKHKFDLVIANAENVAHGKGVTSSTILEMREAGVDFFTTGNHVWANSEGVDNLDDPNFPVLRPANFHNVPGRGYELVEKNGKKFLIINLMGRVFMGVTLDCPFRKFDEIYSKFKKKKVDAVIVDFHAEATSEKKAFQWYTDGRATLVFGTHTHIPTADAQITGNGTAYISDIGMVGPSESVLGVDIDIIVEKFLTQRPRRHEIPSEGPMEFNGIIVDIKKGKATDIKFIRKFFSNVSA
jgi:metallophosphoesterase (TIGR00282 family)